MRAGAGVTRGLDHIVHAVRDLDAAASFYERLGFTVGARNIHPWGTCNQLVQLPGFFIEIVSIADEEVLEAAINRFDGLAQLFGAVIRNHLVRGEGLAFVMLESSDATRDAAEFAFHGIALSGALTFSRQGRLPDGAEATLGFSLAFVGEETGSANGFAVCQQLNPQAFWNKAFQDHRNGAQAVKGAVLVADNPSDHHIFLEAFTGMRAPRSTSLGLVAQTPRGEVEIVEVPFFRDAYGVEVKGEEDLQLAGLRIEVADLAAMRALLAGNHIPGELRGSRLVVGPQAAFGATLVFEEA